MRNGIYFLIISLLILGGCNQSLESDQKNIAAAKQDVRVNLGLGISNRSGRYAGTYDDVINGGHVRLYYSFEGAAEEMVKMNHDGSVWSANLSLSIGNYDFRAEAFNSSNVMIFRTDAPKSYPITADTTNLFLGLQLNPILLNTGDTQIPVITQIVKPSGYNPGKNLRVQFNVEANSSEHLDFHLTVSNDNGTVIAENGYNRHDTNENDGFTTTYNETIEAFIPFATTGDLTIRFSVYSGTLKTGIHAQFELSGSVDSHGESIIFMPVVEWYNLIAMESDNQSLAYLFRVSGREGFTDNVSFQFDDPVVCCATITEYPMDPENPKDVSGELHRDSMEPGKLQLTFTSSDGAYSTSYDFDVPGGPLTEFVTGNPTTHMHDADRFAGTITNPVDGASEDLYYFENIQLYPTSFPDNLTTYFINTNGTATISIHPNGYNGSGWLNFVILDNMSNVVWDETSQNGCNGCSILDLYLPEGGYTLELHLNGTIMPGIEVNTHAVHVVKDEHDQVGILPSWSGPPSKFMPTIDPNQSKTYDVFFNNHNGRLAFVQDNSSADVRFELIDANGDPVLVNTWDGQSSLDGPREMILGGHDRYVPTGWYQLSIHNQNPDQWNGIVAVYGGYDVPWDLAESGFITDVEDDVTVRFQNDYNLRDYADNDSINYIVDVSSECSKGKALTLTNRNPYDFAALVATHPSGNLIAELVDDSRTTITSCLEPIAIRIMAHNYYPGMPDSHVELRLDWPPVVVSGTNDWSYSDPTRWAVYEPTVWCNNCYTGFDIWWTNQADNESFTVVNTNTDIQLGYWDHDIQEEVWVDGATPARNLDHDNGHDWIRVRYTGPNIEETISRTIRVEFQSTSGSPSYTSADITFEVRDND